MTARKFYLGDSVYAELKDGQLILTTENGYGASNRIVLEPEVYRALVRVAEDRPDTTRRRS